MYLNTVFFFFLSEETNKSFRFIWNHVLLIGYETKHFKPQFRDSFENTKYLKGKKGNVLVGFFFSNPLAWTQSISSGFFFIWMKVTENSVSFITNNKFHPTQLQVPGLERVSICLFLPLIPFPPKEQSLFQDLCIFVGLFTYYWYASCAQCCLTCPSDWLPA